MQATTNIGAGDATPTMNPTQADPRMLLDWSTPFDDFKVQVLENVVNVMFGGTGQNVITHPSLI
jgi:hypothetical protein